MRYEFSLLSIISLNVCLLRVDDSLSTIALSDLLLDGECMSLLAPLRPADEDEIEAEEEDPEEVEGEEGEEEGEEAGESESRTRYSMM